jgi:general secretion pathway protein J
VTGVRPAGGFTLVEVLIALAITAFVAAAAYSGISAVLTAAEQLGASGTRLADINRALGLLDRDLRQFIDRPVRDEYSELQPGLSGGPLAYFPLALTRAGWHNSRALPRSDLQRVYYYLEDGALWRAYYPVLDRGAAVERLEARLLDDVEEFELRFLRAPEELRISKDSVVDTLNWERNWVSDRSGVEAALPQPPLAVEVRLQLADLGFLRRLYVLPGR